MATIDFQQFATEAAYAAADKPTTASRISSIAETDRVAVDGVNVRTDEPEDGDALFLDENNKKVWLKGGDALNVSLLPNSWTKVGAVFARFGRKVLVVDKGYDTKQWLGCWQYAITAISATTIKFWLKMAGDYGTFVPIEVQLTSAEINATTVAEINAALEAAGNTGNVGYDKHGYWAYLADDNNEPVESDGTNIVVQCDFNGSYQQYQCSDSTHALVGCTMALCVWEDMPATSTGCWRRDNGNNGILNLTRGSIYCSTNGSSPSANVPLNDTSQIVKKADFENSQYCAALRAAYATYDDYLLAEKIVIYPNKKGPFSLPPAQELNAKYGNRTFIKKDGTEVYKYPALRYAETVGYSCDGLRAGDWWLPGDEIVPLMADGDVTAVDANMVKRMYNNTLKKMSGAQVANNAPRWVALRCTAYNAWSFSGNYGYIGSGYGNPSYRCQAVTLCDID